MLRTTSVAAVIAALVLAGCNSAGGHSPPGARPGTATSTTGAGSELTAGKLTLRAPAGWRITASDGRGDYVISTTACDATDDVWGASCPAVLVLTASEPGLGGAGIGIGSEGQRPYTPSQPYHPSSGVLPCPQYPNSAAAPGSPRHSSAPVAGRTANYAVWPFTCNTGTGAHAGSFEQRDWYLPVSKVLIVDQYRTPGLAAILKDASLS